MTFTSRDLRGWFHTFTGLPLVHTSNPDFWDDVFDLASPWLPKLYSWKSPVIGVSELRLLETPEFRRFQVSWTSQVSRLPNFAGSRSPELHQFPDSRTSQVPGLLNFASFQTPELRRFQVSWISLVSNHPETDSRFANWSQFGYYFRISLEGQRNVWNSSGSLHECFVFTKQNFPSRC
jgi:hypothetical protein